MTHPPVRLPACCSGVAEMATHLWQDLEAFIARAPGDVHFAGHSLGGSLSLLLTVMSHLRLGMPGQRMTATTFGSPPVLSLRQGEDGDALLEVRGGLGGSCGLGWAWHWKARRWGSICAVCELWCGGGCAHIWR